jgi:hypothetical protein
MGVDVAEIMVQHSRTRVRIAYFQARISFRFGSALPVVLKRPGNVGEFRLSVGP